MYAARAQRHGETSLVAQLFVRHPVARWQRRSCTRDLEHLWAQEAFVFAMESLSPSTSSYSPATGVAREGCKTPNQDWAVCPRVLECAAKPPGKVRPPWDSASLERARVAVR